MADVTQLQATLSITSSNVVEGGTVPFTVNIHNTIGNNIGFWINSVIINEIEALLVEEPTPVSINYRANGSLNGEVYLPEISSKDATITVNIGYGSTGGNEYTSSVSSIFNIKPDLILDNKIVNNFMVENKRIIKLDADGTTIWHNGVWFNSTPEFIGYNRLDENNNHETASVTGAFYRHNHLIRDSEVTIYKSNDIIKKGLSNAFDFFTEYGALTVTRTLNGFTASGEQQATYTCNTLLESDMIINFDIPDINVQENVFLEVFNEDNSYYDKINLSSFKNSNVQLKFNNFRKFTLYVDGEEYDVYESDDPYYKFRFNIGGGNITVDNFRVERKLSSSQLNVDGITNSYNLEAYKSYIGTRIRSISSNSGFILGGQLSNEISRLDVDIVKITGQLKVYMYNKNEVLSDYVPNNSHLTITHDGYYTEIFVDNTLIKSIKNEGMFPYYLFYLSGECIIKNMEVHSFALYDSFITDNDGEITLEHTSQNKGDVYFLGRFEDLPTISYHLEDCTYKPEYVDQSDVIKEASNGNAYTIVDSDTAKFKGAVLNGGWDNTGLWECTFDLAYLNGLRYTGIVLLTNLDTPFSGWGIRNWEGPITSNPTLDSGTANFVKSPDVTLTDLPSGTSINNNPVVDWHTVHMRKTSPTRLEVWKNDDVANKVIYEWEQLSEKSRVTIGGVTNLSNSYATSQYGSTCIRNLRVKTY